MSSLKNNSKKAPMYPSIWVKKQISPPFHFLYKLYPDNPAPCYFVSFHGFTFTAVIPLLAHATIKLVTTSLIHSNLLLDEQYAGPY